MARWFVVIWLFALVGGVSIIIATRPTVAPDRPAPPPAPVASVNEVLASVRPLVREYLACEHRCERVFTRAGGLENVVTVLDYSLEEVTTARRCKVRLTDFQRELRAVGETLAETSDARLRRFAASSQAAVRACREQEIPLRR